MIISGLVEGFLNGSLPGTATAILRTCRTKPTRRRRPRLPCRRFRHGGGSHTADPVRGPADTPVLAGITWRVLLVAFAFFVVVWLLFQVAPVAFALFLALFVTALADPIARLLHRILPVTVSVVLSLLLIAVVGGFILFTVIRSIVNEGPALSAAITDGIQEVEDWLQNGPLHMTGDQLASLQNESQSWLKDTGESLLADVASDLGDIGIIITAGSVFVFAVLFFMTSGQAIWDWLVGWIPERARAAFDVSGQLAWGTMAGYTRGMVVVALCDAFLVFIGLTILQVPLAPALAAVVFMGAFIPVIGAPIATLLASLVALATKGPTTALLVVALTIIVGSFDGDVMQPLVMGKAVSLHPLAIVTIIAAGALTFGVIGALIAIPIASSAYVVLKYLAGRDPDHPYPLVESESTEPQSTQPQPAEVTA